MHDGILPRWPRIWQSTLELFFNTFKNKHVRVHGGTDSKHETRETGEPKRDRNNLKTPNVSAI